MDSMSTVKRCFSEVLGCVIYTLLIFLVATASGLCPEFDSSPYLESGLLCSISVIFFMLSVAFNLVLIALPGVFFYSVALFLVCTEPYLGNRVSEGVQVLIYLFNLSTNILASLIATSRKW